jgi:hypothetical protein
MQCQGGKHSKKEKGGREGVKIRTALAVSLSYKDILAYPSKRSMPIHSPENSKHHTKWYNSNRYG